MSNQPWLNVPIPLPDEMSVALVDSIEPRQFEDTQKTDRAGTPLWIVRASIRVDGRRRELPVLVATPTAPVAEPDSFVQFVGLTVTYWVREGRSGLVFHAQAVADADGRLLGGAGS